MTNTEPTTHLGVPVLTDAQIDALETMAIERASYNGSGLPGVVLSAATARVLIEYGYAEVVHQSGSLGSHRHGITRAGLEAYAAIGGDVPAEWIAKPMSDGAQRGQMVADEYDRADQSFSTLLADLAEYAAHLGRDWDAMTSIAGQRAQERATR